MQGYPGLTLYVAHLFCAFGAASIAWLMAEGLSRRGDWRSTWGAWPMTLFFLPVCILISAILAPLTGSTSGTGASGWVVAAGVAAAGLAILLGRARQGCFTFFLTLPLFFVAAWLLLVPLRLLA